MDITTEQVERLLAGAWKVLGTQRRPSQWALLAGMLRLYIVRIGQLSYEARTQRANLEAVLKRVRRNLIAEMAS